MYTFTNKNLIFLKLQVLLHNIVFPEGPAFDHKGRIWLVEKEAGNLIVMDNNIATRIHTGGHPNGIAIDKNNVVWFCDSLQNSIRTYNPSTQQCQTIIASIAGEKLKMPNDLAFDHTGNLLFTCPGDTLEDGSGYICCLTPHQKLSIIYTDMFYPNGLAFSKDYKTLYVAETGTHFIWKFDWNPASNLLSNAKKWVYAGGPIGPDGIALDEEENLYIAVFGSGYVKKANAQGVLVEQIELIGKNPTNCAIDPMGKMGILVTEAETGSLIQIPSKAKGIL